MEIEDEHEEQEYKGKRSREKELHRDESDSDKEEFETWKSQLETQLDVPRKKLTIGGKSKKIAFERRNWYDDSQPQLGDVMSLTSEERNQYLKQVENPFRWPKEYYEIYMEEKMIRDPKGFDHLAFINKVPLFQPRSDNVGKTRIQQTQNINCIKSRKYETIDMDIFEKICKFYKVKIIQNLYLALGMSEYCYTNNKTNYFSKTVNDLNFSINSILNPTVEIKFLTVEVVKNVLENLPYITSDMNIESLISKSLTIDRQLYSLEQSIFSNHYRTILFIIKQHFGEYSQFISIAGGFALSMYIYENYGYSPNFSDIDLFIHGCNEQTANEIVKLFNTFIKRSSLNFNENVIFGNLDFFYHANWSIEDDEYFSYHFDFYEGREPISMQIIRRLYTCPAQIILGFDVDCCCILTTLDGDIYTSKRGAYAIKNGYNIVNFDKLSPSYEYRLAKYNTRGFGIWIPFIEYFKQNAVFDVRELDKSKPSSIILRSLMNVRQRRNTSKITQVSDYRNTIKNQIYEDEYLSFKILNPSEQIIGTFHRIVLEDFINWYPLRQPYVKEFVSVNQYSAKDVIEFDYKDISYNLYPSMNIIKSNYRDISTIKCRESCKRVLDVIARLLPGIKMSGNTVESSLTGVPADYQCGGSSCYEIKIDGYDHIMTKRTDKILEYEIIKTKILNAVNLKLMQHEELKEFCISIDDDLNKLGRVVFINRQFKIDNYENISDEKSYQFFKDNDYKGYIRFSYKYPNLANDALFIPSPLLTSFIAKQVYTSIVSLKYLYQNMLSLSGKFTITHLERTVENKEHNQNIIINRRNNKALQNFLSYFMNTKLSNTFEKVLKIIYCHTPALFEQCSSTFSSIKISGKCYRLIDKTKTISLVYDRMLILTEEIRETISEFEFFERLYLSIINFESISVDIDTGIVDQRYSEDNKFIYCNGKYYSSSYNCNLISLGIREEMINRGRAKIFDYPAWENFIPKIE